MKKINTSGPLTEKGFEDFLEQAFRYGGGRKKVIYAPKGWLKGMEDFFLSKGERAFKRALRQIKSGVHGS